MQTCKRCGKENNPDASICLECGFDLDDSPRQDPLDQLLDRSNKFYNWTATSISLAVLASFYGFVAFLALWQGSKFSQRGEHYWARYSYWGAFWNVIIAVLCFAGRWMMSSRTPRRLLAGAITIAVALFLVMRIWVAGFLSGRNPFPGIEALLIWPPLVYAIIYAYRGSKQ